jgi:hypothetical protein
MNSKKKGGGIGKLFQDLIKRPKSANDSASQSNSAQVSVSSAASTHYPVPGNDEGIVEPTVSSKYINPHLSVIDEDLCSPDPFQSAMAVAPSSVSSAVGQGD